MIKQLFWKSTNDSIIHRIRQCLHPLFLTTLIHIVVANELQNLIQAGLVH